MRRRLALVLLALLLPSAARAQPLTVFAAASLTDTLRDIAAAWTQSGNPGLRLVFGASSTLARQIEQGAPASLFIAADERWMDVLADRGLLAPGARRDLLGNRLALIVPRDRARTVAIGPGLDLGALLGPDGRLAIADPAHVPAGIYARQALTRLGLWAQLEPRLARAQDVRGALLLVERGEAPAGIVYTTDAAASTGVAVAGVVPDGMHDAIVYPAAVVRDGDGPHARALLAFLQGGAARAIFVRHGFRPLG